MPSTCEFKLDKTDEIYFAGTDAITGTVTLVTSQEKKVLYILMGFKGECKVLYIVKAKSDSIPSAENTIVDEGFAKQLYVNDRVAVQGAGVLEAGTHTWPFRFYVPERCLTSLEGENGQIRYQLYLKIKNREKYDNFFTKPVTVIKTYDLNLSPALKMSQACEINATYSLRAFRLRALFCLGIPTGGYAPGQSLKFVLICYEKSANQIDRFLVQFMQKKKLKTVTPRPSTHRLKTILCETEILDNGGNFQVATNEILIPSISPTTCAKYITVEYVLVLKAKLKLSTTRLTAKVPIIIGTVPLKQNLLPEQQSLVSSEVEENDFGGSTLRYIITPPAFERAMRTEKPFTDIHTLLINRVDDFLPIYPSYKVHPA